MAASGSPPPPLSTPYAAKIITFVNTAFIHVLANFIVHMHHRVKDAPPFEVHAMDDNAYLICTRMLTGGLNKDSCVRADCCNWTHGFPVKLTRDPIHTIALPT